MGLILSDYIYVGAQSGALGYPTTDEGDTLFGDGRYNLFQKGRILWKRGTSKANATQGRINDYYTTVAMEWGPLGYPLTDEFAFGSTGGRQNTFEFGKIYYYNSRAQAMVTNLNPGVTTRLTQQNAPRITSVSLVGAAVGDACINHIQGGGFPPSTLVSFVANAPTGAYSFTGSVWADGSGNFDYWPSSGSACVQVLPKINGYATIQANGGGARAIYAHSTSLGTNWAGAQ
jgi:hypothetical protein